MTTPWIFFAVCTDNPSHLFVVKPGSGLDSLCRQRFDEEGKHYPYPLPGKLCPSCIDEHRAEAALIIDDGFACLQDPSYTGDEQTVLQLAERQGPLEDSSLEQDLHRVPVHG